MVILQIPKYFQAVYNSHYTREKEREKIDFRY